MLETNRQRRPSKRVIMKRRRIVTILGLTILALIFGYLTIRFLRNENVLYLENMNRGTYSFNKLKKIQEDYESNLNIKEIDFKWTGEFESGNNPKYLVYHHTASSEDTPEGINKTHIDNGWGGIGYHYYIRKDGSIYKGRPEGAVGAHAIGRNRDSIGICLEGNFEKTKPTEEQLNSIVKLSVDMIIKYNIGSSIGHKDVYETLCPGKKFPMDDIKNRVADELLKEIN
ncbi:peptidoglycan recognition protein family protein [Clostridium paraputrificum]|uniref:peptidoglycan recognition protein family protein n=1 Tax=Clostridium TaxID=1485 RepID=UPI003D346504